MATTTPPQASSDDAERIVGEQLEADLIDAGLEPRPARAIRHALQFVVLRLLLLIPTRTEVHQIVNDSADGLRRESQIRFDAIDQRFDDLQRQMRWQFYVLFALMLMLFGAVLSSLFV